MARDAFHTNFFCYAEKICKQAEDFDADAIINDAEAELFNCTENVYDDLSDLDTVSIYASASIAYAMDW